MEKNNFSVYLKENYNVEDIKGMSSYLLNEIFYGPSAEHKINESDLGDYYWLVTFSYGNDKKKTFILSSKEHKALDRLYQESLN